MDLKPRSLHIGRAQRVLAAVGIELAGAVTSQFVAELLAAVDADRAGEAPAVLLECLLAGRPGRVAELVADEPLMRRAEAGDGDRESLERFVGRIVALHRERRYSLDPPPLPPEIRERLIASAVVEARSTVAELRLLAARRLTILGDHDDLLERLARDPDAPVAHEARTELDRRRRG